MRILLLFVLFVPFVSYAQVFTLQDAISMGLQKSFDIQMDKVNEDIRKEQAKAEEANFDPVFKASAGADVGRTPTAYAPYNMDYLRENTYAASASLSKLHKNGMMGEFVLKTQRADSNDPFEELDPSYRTILEMNISQPLLKNYGKDIMGTNVKTAKLAVQQARFDLYYKMTVKAEQIQEAYYSLAKANELLKLAEQSKALALSLLESDRKRFAAGIVPVTEVQEAETAAAGRDEQVISAQSAVESAQNRLENLINPDFDLTSADLEPLKGEWEDISTDDTYKTALDKRPDLAVQKLELEKHDVKIQYLKNQELPELDLVSTLGVSGLSGDERTSNRFDGGYQDSVFDTGRGSGYEMFVGVNFSVPIGQRGAKAKAAAAQGEKYRSVYALKKMETDIKTEVKNAATLIDSSRKRYEVSQTFMTLSEKTLSQEMKKLKEGLSDTFRILKFQSDVIEAKMRAVNALYDYNRGMALLYKSDGTNLDREGFRIGEYK